MILALPLMFTNYGISEQITENASIYTPEPGIQGFEDRFIHQLIEANGFAITEKNYSEAEEIKFLYTKSEGLEIKKESLKKEDILKAVPSISTEDNKTLGLLIPPFAYFAKRF
jgi:hypothetical protein